MMLITHLTEKKEKQFILVNNMAQTLKPNRLDNRGGNKKKTSTKIMFSYRIEPHLRKQIVEFIKTLQP